MSSSSTASVTLEPLCYPPDRSIDNTVTIGTPAQWCAWIPSFYIDESCIDRCNYVVAPIDGRIALSIGSIYRYKNEVTNPVLHAANFPVSVAAKTGTASGWSYSIELEPELYVWTDNCVSPVGGETYTRNEYRFDYPDNEFEFGMVSQGDTVVFQYTHDEGEILGSFLNPDSNYTQLLEQAYRWNILSAESAYVNGFDNAAGPVMCLGEDHGGYQPTKLEIETHLEFSQVRVDTAATRDTLTIEIDDPKEVWPSIPDFGWQNQILNDVENVLSPITVTVTENGSPVASQEVELSMAWVDTSGGHVHAQTADPDASPKPIPKGIPHLSGSNLGSFGLSTGTLISSTDSTLVANTDQNGEISVSYTAGEFGGRVAFTASTLIGTVDVTDTDTVTVTVPNLTKLPDVPQTEYKKLGGTLNHPGPDDKLFGGDFSHDPDYNHWVRVDALLSIEEIAASWVDAKGEALWINDMSLVYGGDFDIDGIWAGSHGHHRVGRDADFRTTTASEAWGIHIGPDTLGGLPYVFATGLKKGSRFFEKIVRDNCGAVYPEFRRSHYHVRFYPDTMENCK